MSTRALAWTTPRSSVTLDTGVASMTPAGARLRIHREPGRVRDGVEVRVALVLRAAGGEGKREGEDGESGRALHLESPRGRRMIGRPSAPSSTREGGRGCGRRDPRHATGAGQVGPGRERDRRPWAASRARSTGLPGIRAVAAVTAARREAESRAREPGSDAQIPRSFACLTRGHGSTKLTGLMMEERHTRLDRAGRGAGEPDRGQPSDGEAAFPSLHPARVTSGRAARAERDRRSRRTKAR